MAKIIGYSLETPAEMLALSVHYVKSELRQHSFHSLAVRIRLYKQAVSIAYSYADSTLYLAILYSLCRVCYDYHNSTVLGAGIEYVFVLSQIA